MLMFNTNNYVEKHKFTTRVYVINDSLIYFVLLCEMITCVYLKLENGGGGVVCV